MRSLCCALLLSLAGCAQLGSKEATIGCQLADGITTYTALSRGAVETNGLMKGMGGSGILLFKLALAALAWAYWDDVTEKGQNKDAVGAFAAINVITCAAAANNISVMR